MRTRADGPPPKPHTLRSCLHFSIAGNGGEGMKAPLACNFGHELKSIPPLSQSRHGDLACETLYVRKHVLCARVGESEPAARGIEIHEILATYINRLVAARRSTDLELFDALMKGVGTESREVLEKFRDNHAFDPEKILAASS
jgi:hypothetical protein